MVSSTLFLFSEASAVAAPTFGENVGAYFQSMFKKVAEIPLPMWIVLIALTALGVVLLVLGSKQQKWSATTIAYAALAIALSFLLSNIRLYRMPQGGSITAVSMLPLMLFSYSFGIIPGLLTGTAYGVLQFLQTPSLLPIAPLYAFCQVILDYILAFGCMGLVGMFGKNQGNDRVYLPSGIAVASVLRFVCSVFSGVLFFAEYAGDQNPWIYSAAYNGSYMLPELILTAAVGALIGPRLCRVLRRTAAVR